MPSLLRRLLGAQAMLTALNKGARMKMRWILPTWSFLWLRCQMFLLTRSFCVLRLGGVQLGFMTFSLEWLVDDEKQTGGLN